MKVHFHNDTVKASLQITRLPVTGTLFLKIKKDDSSNEMVFAIEGEQVEQLRQLLGDSELKE